MKKVRLLILTAIMALSVWGLAGCGKTKVSLNDYVKINAEGYDTVGKLVYTFDQDSFVNDYKGKIKIKDKEILKQLGQVSDIGAVMLFFNDCISVKIDKTDNLKNGDSVKLTWQCDEERAAKVYGVQLKYSDIDYEVNGLTEVGRFNPFDNIKVCFEGKDPNGTARCEVVGNSPEMSYIYFEIDKSSGLKNGDTITIKASVSYLDSFIAEFGKVLEKTEETYAVEGLAKYVSDISDIPTDMYDKMNKQLEDAFYAHAAANWEKTSKIISFELIGNYFLKLKEGMSGNKENYLYYVYKVVIDTDEVKGFTYYWYGRFSDIVILPDGTCSVDLSKYKTPEGGSFFGVYGEAIKCGTHRYVLGFADLTTLFNEHVTANIENYEYVNTVKE